MAVFQVDADVLARTRFGTSQLAETVAAVSILQAAQPFPWHRVWKNEHVEPFRSRLADDPVTAAIVEYGFSTTWIADYVAAPPERPDLTLDDELAVLSALSDDQVRADLARGRARLPAQLCGTGLATRTADLLRWVWRQTIEADWSRRQAVLRADVVSRISALSQDGWSGVMNNLRSGMRWLGAGELQVNEDSYPPCDVRGRELTFIAAHCRGGWASWRMPDRFAIVYPVTGVFAQDPVRAPDHLVDLLGRARSTVLVGASSAISTTGLVATTGLPLGTVGNHLRVLLHSGLLHRRRSGREVLYWWTDTARALVTGA
ncbi:ArsR/SmtB family transcription factor [Actinophytocola sediminis]